MRQWEAVPWRDSDYPAARPGEPLASRIQRYAASYWRQRLEAEAQADQPPGKADRSVLLPFDRSSLPPRDPATPKQLLDLTDHYTGSVDGHDLYSYGADSNSDLRSLPRGLVQLGGTQFDMGAQIRLYHVILDNPRPEAEVATLQCIGATSRAAPFIVAMTV